MRRRRLDRSLAMGGTLPSENVENVLPIRSTILQFRLDQDLWLNSTRLPVRKVNKLERCQTARPTGMAVPAAISDAAFLLEAQSHSAQRARVRTARENT